jgi:excisionase family DNA binding protein
MDEFLTVPEVAKILKLNQQSGRNWIDQGQLGAVRVGRRVRIRRSDFQALLDQGQSPAHTEMPAYDAQAFWEGEEPPLPGA